MSEPCTLEQFEVPRGSGGNRKKSYASETFGQCQNQSACPGCGPTAAQAGRCITEFQVATVQATLVRTTDRQAGFFIAEHLVGTILFVDVFCFAIRYVCVRCVDFDARVMRVATEFLGGLLVALCPVGPGCA